jgi:serine/threonine protein kinase
MIACGSCGANNVDSARFCESCGKPLTKVEEVSLAGLHTIDPAIAAAKAEPEGKSLLDLKPDEIFADRYRVVAEIGRGGMGVVYRAHDPVTQRDVALKLIRADRLAGKDAVKRLVREGVLARDIRHPNVVAVYDVGEVKGLPFLTMELLEGGSLRAWMQARMRQGRDSSMATAANVIREVLSGLQAAHAQGVIHRDLKPENIVLMGEPNDHEARLKILDFGIARAGGGSDTGSTSLGTLEYMAPEQITAPEAAQTSADFYSLSVMFYELLIGVVPKGHWQPPSGGRSDVPPAIDKLIERGLSNNPRQRQQSAQQYRADLDAALSGFAPGPAPGPGPSPYPGPGPAPQPGPYVPPTPRPPGSGGFAAWFQNMTPAKIAIVAGVAVLVVGGIFAAMMDTPTSPQQQQQQAQNGQGANTQPVQPVQPLQPNQPPPPLPPPDTGNYPILSGSWFDHDGYEVQVAVSPYGEVQGQVMSGPNAGMGFVGEFDGTYLEYIIGNDQVGILFAGAGEWLNICHVGAPEVDPSTGQPTGGFLGFHIRHKPSARCF